VSDHEHSGNKFQVITACSHREDPTTTSNAGDEVRTVASIAVSADAADR